MRYTIVPLLTLIFPSILFANNQDACNMPKILTQIRPGARWNMRGSTPADLEWLDNKQTKPSLSEINNAQQNCLNNEKHSQVLKEQAKANLKNKALTTDQRLDAL